jgi:cyclohexanone monooxygenase
MTTVPTPAELGFDPAELRRKYDRERDKRLRADGTRQYRPILGELDHLDTDPWADPDFTREPVRAETDVVILGGGFSGLMTAAALMQRGVSDFRLVEAGADVGGTWYWNRYPGAQCDTCSYIYLPLLEETGYLPTEKYAHQPEILEHARRIARQFGVYDRALLQTRLTSARWDASTRRWILRTDRGDELAARFLVPAGGGFNAPKLPRIPGLDTFRGRIFHSSRWDYAYTGGGPSGGLDQLADKRVGLVGNGCTGLQIAPFLAESAQQLYCFQRTPSLISERNNAPTDPDWAAALEPGWWHRLNINFIEQLTGATREDLIQDGWTKLFGSDAPTMARAAELTTEELHALLEIGDFQFTNGLRDRIASIVKDPAVAADLMGWYGKWCKRPMFSDAYFQIFNRPNVTVVNTDGQGIERLTPAGVVAAGTEWELDCLIFASGFELATTWTHKAQLELTGRDGLKLSDHWATGMSTFQRAMTRGFPNCLFVGLIEASNVAPNFLYPAHQQAEHVAWIIDAVLARGGTSVEVTADAEAESNRLNTQPSVFEAYFARCTPGYFNAEGSGGSFLTQEYPGGQLTYFADTERWREAGQLEGLEVITSQPTV